MAELTASAGQVSAKVTIKRPRFDDLWQAYSEVGNKKADPVYQLIGGNVAELREQNPADYTNACALRMSRAFNYGNFKIPKGTIIKNRNIYRVKGKDTLPYIMRVNDLIPFIIHNWGQADLSLDPINISQLMGKKGLIVINVSGWGDATGHVTLWNGSITGDGTNYQDVNSDAYRDTPNVKPTKILYWELK